MTTELRRDLINYFATEDQHGSIKREVLETYSDRVLLRMANLMAHVKNVPEWIQELNSTQTTENGSNLK